MREEPVHHTSHTRTLHAHAEDQCLRLDPDRAILGALKLDAASEYGRARDSRNTCSFFDKRYPRTIVSAQSTQVGFGLQSTMHGLLQLAKPPLFCLFCKD